MARILRNKPLGARCFTFYDDDAVAFPIVPDASEYFLCINKVRGKRNVNGEKTRSERNNRSTTHGLFRTARLGYAGVPLRVINTTTRASHAKLTIKCTPLLPKSN